MPKTRAGIQAPASAASETVAPATAIPGMLFVQGWGSGQDVYLPRARQIAALGCVGLTFEPRGVARGDPRHGAVSREDNLRDLVAAYDLLAGRPGVASVIVGARTPEQLASNLRSSAVELTVDDLRLLDEASDPEPAPWPYGAAGLEQRSRPID